MNKNQLSNATDVYPSLLEFHLEQLEAGGMLVRRPSAQDREVLCFLPEDEHLWENEQSRILFGRSPVRHVGMFVAENPGARVKEIAEALGLATVTVRYHVRTLESHDLVQRTKEGRAYAHEPTPPLEDWVERLGQGFERPWSD